MVVKKKHRDDMCNVRSAASKIMQKMARCLRINRYHVDNAHKQLRSIVDTALYCHFVVFHKS